MSKSVPRRTGLWDYALSFLKFGKTSRDQRSYWIYWSLMLEYINFPIVYINLQPWELQDSSLPSHPLVWFSFQIRRHCICSKTLIPQKHSCIDIVLNPVYMYSLMYALMCVLLGSEWLWKQLISATALSPENVSSQIFHEDTVIPKHRIFWIKYSSQKNCTKVCIWY